MVFDERDLCRVMSGCRGRAGWAVCVSRRQMQSQESGVTVLYLPHSLESQHHLLQVLFSKQGLGNRFSVINAFHCVNTVRSGKQERLLGDIQLHPWHLQAFQDLVKLMQPHCVGRDRMWQILYLLQSCAVPLFSEVWFVGRKYNTTE